MDSTITIIIPVYNAQNTIDRCIESVVKQTLTALEIIIVDDGSTDAGLSICEKWAARDDRIKLLKKENGGVSSARNAGLAAANGQYIMFCDADDRVLPMWCERMFNTLQANPHAFVTANVMIVDNEKKHVFCQHEPVAPISYFDLFKTGLSPFPVNKIFEKEVIDKYGLKFDETMQIGEDVKFTLAYYAHCSCIKYIHEPLYEYHTLVGSATQRYYPDLFSRNLSAFALRWKYIREDERREYCNIWLYRFYCFLNNTMDDRNTWPFCKKVRYNQKMMETKEFKICIAYADSASIGEKEYRLLKKGYFIPFYLFCKLARLKEQYPRYKRSPK